MSETEKPGWMPVFVLVQRNQAMHAAHPDHKAALPEVHAEDSVQRIGTAWLEENGSYVIQLVALPVNGRLLMRPPSADEHPNSTFKEVR